MKHFVSPSFQFGAKNWSPASGMAGQLGYDCQEPITRSLQLPHIPVTAFSQTDLFLV